MKSTRFSSIIFLFDENPSLHRKQLFDTLQWPRNIFYLFLFIRKYTIARLFNLARFQPIDANDSGLYILELELAGDGLDYTQRVIEYVYLKNDKDEKASGEVSQLCYPKVLGWSKEAFLHLIVAVNHEGQRLHRFLEKLERIFEENLEVDFRLVVVHSGKSGIDIESILQESLLQNYIVYELEGEFSWARAINHGIKSIQDPTHVVLTAGVHMDLPASIFEDCRKVSHYVHRCQAKSQPRSQR